MKESRKTKKQLEKEDEQREQANRSFLRSTERLIQWMAFKDFLRNGFYRGILDFATEKEDQGEADDFGFSIYLYNTNHKHPYFFLNGTGLYGLSELVGRATKWLQEEINIQRRYQNTEAPPNFTVGEEMGTGYLRDNLDAFADACEAIGRLNDDLWVNMSIAFYISNDHIPKDLDFGNVETESLCYPDLLQKKFESVLNDIMDN